MNPVLQQQPSQHQVLQPYACASQPASLDGKPLTAFLHNKHQPASLPATTRCQLPEGRNQPLLRLTPAHSSRNSVPNSCCCSSALHQTAPGCAACCMQLGQASSVCCARCKVALKHSLSTSLGMLRCLHSTTQHSTSQHTALRYVSTYHHCQRK
jgi:hypothetical protein